MYELEAIITPLLWGGRNEIIAIIINIYRVLSICPSRIVLNRRLPCALPILTHLILSLEVRKLRHRKNMRKTASTVPGTQRPPVMAY